MESRLEKYKNIKLEKRQRRIKKVIIILSIIILIYGMNIVDRAVRDMMCIYDRQLYFFNHDNDFYRLHLFGQDYLVEKKQINDKIYKTKGIIEDFTKLVNDYSDKVLKIIRTR
ncbi:MAG: hypothetical protein EWM50_02765 [Gottschalkiaceae bacterium]|uniref:hypothetical protein n=1 Tax=Proteiniborus ethanoligenes TaxID=415015 RepID=UPI000B86EE56|nr:hypothetical protein [Proteiniborus ethanoligenes]TAH63423.1 MAG: hypothetical protein EWM50_02765 [Gottschalkiaceae bacterium]